MNQARSTPRATRLRIAALALWLVGVQVHEALGTAGIAVLAASFIPSVLSAPRARWLAGARHFWPVLAFVGWSLVAPALLGAPPNGQGVARTLDWLAIPLLAIAATQLEPGTYRGLWLAAGVTIILSSAVAGLQHVGLWPPLSAFSGLEWTHISFARVYEAVPGTEHRYMGGGLLFHRLKFGHVTGLLVIGAVVMAQASTGRARAVLLASAGVGFVAVWLFPFARMAAAAMTVGLGLAVVSVLPRRQAIIAGVGLMAAIAVMLAAVPSLRERFASALTDTGSGQRTYHLRAGLEAVAAHPVAGVGPGQFRPSAFPVGDMPQHVKDNPGKAHNQLVSIAAETGVVGLGLFLLLLGWVWAHARRADTGAMGTGALLTFLVLGLAHDPLFQAPASLALVAVLGLSLRGSPLTQTWLSREGPGP